MQTVYLKILQFLGNSGYYARTDGEKIILSNLIEKGYVQVKNGTKNVFKLTSEGLKYVDRELYPNTSITDQDFLSCLKEAYDSLSNPMKPLVKIPDIRKKLSDKRIPDNAFDSRVLNLHDEGIITLQTALSKTHAVHGGIESNSGTGIFYFMMFEA